MRPSSSTVVPARDTRRPGSAHDDRPGPAAADCRSEARADVRPSAGSGAPARSRHHSPHPPGSKATTAGEPAAVSCAERPRAGPEWCAGFGRHRRVRRRRLPRLGDRDATVSSASSTRTRGGHRFICAWLSKSLRRVTEIPAPFATLLVRSITTSIPEDRLAPVAPHAVGLERGRPVQSGRPVVENGRPRQLLPARFAGVVDVDAVVDPCPDPAAELTGDVVVAAACGQHLPP